MVEELDFYWPVVAAVGSVCNVVSGKIIIIEEQEIFVVKKFFGRFSTVVGMKYPHVDPVEVA